MRRVDRRAAFGIWGTSIMSAVGACTDKDVTVVQTPEGPVLQMEKDEFLVLVSGFAPTYHPGDTIRLHVIVNNQSRRFATARIRTKLIGRGQQVVAEAEVVQIDIKPTDATAVERSLLIPNDMPLGDYTLQVELPPWSFEGRQAGGGTLSTPVKVVA
ncbi:MAG: hypothetical protein IT305_17715 [Chloroflexi bacterium]|nr:hypothetical protein [Chloroflexota bacterium]